VLCSRYFRNKFKTAPIHLAIEVTKRCNAKCRFCDYWKEDLREKWIDFKRLQNMIKPIVISLTGGEPLLRKDLPAVIKELRANDPHVYIMMITNGALLTLSKAKELQEAGMDQISISLDYLGEKHDQNRGIPGLYTKILKVIPEIRKLNFASIAFNTVIINDNLDEIPKILLLAQDLGIQIAFSSYSPLKNNNQAFMVKTENREKLDKTIAFILEKKQMNRRLIKSSRYYLKNVGSYFVGEEIPNCKAGIHWVLVTPDGKMKRCSEFSSETDVDSYTLSSFKPTSCTRCWFSCRGEAQCPINYERVKELFL